MKIHPILIPPELIVSFGLETRVVRSFTGYNLEIVTYTEVPDCGFHKQDYEFGIVEIEHWRNESIDGHLVTISPLEPLFRVIRRLIRR